MSLFQFSYVSSIQESQSYVIAPYITEHPYLPLSLEI